MSMLQTLADECKQLVWEFLDVTELCRMACVCRDVEQGVSLRPIWLRNTRALVTRETEALRHETGLLGCRLQRGLASRNLIANSKQRMATPSLLQAGIAVEWRLWYRDTHTALVAFRKSNNSFSTSMDALQELKTERSELKEALQNVKSQAHADKKNRRVQMNCVRWMNRTHRRYAATANSIQAQNAAMTRAELAERLKQVESSIQVKTKEIFTARMTAMKSLHRVNTQLASGTKLLQDLDICGEQPQISV